MEAHGHAAFEFTCRKAVRLIGTHFINLSRLAARPALEHYETTAGIKPSFQIGAAFGAKLRERTADGQLIIRQASSEFFQEEGMADRFTRILGRPEHRDIRYVLDNLEATSAELLRVILLSDSIVGMLKELEGEMRLASMEGDVTGNPGIRSSSGIGPTRVNVYLNNIVESDSVGVPALDDAFKILRDQVLREKSCSL